MDGSTYDLPSMSTCTSCTFKEDLSNYWTADLFFKAKNGTFKRVPQVGNGGPQGQLVNKGGLDIYYIPSGKVTAFKKVCIGKSTPALHGTALDRKLTSSRASACWLARLPTPTPRRSTRA